jgi:uncharacterized membrane protein
MNALQRNDMPADAVLANDRLVIPKTATGAAVCLAALLVALFPANVRAAREKLTFGGRPATALPLRTLLQLVYIAATLVAGFPGAFPLVAG